MPYGITQCYLPLDRGDIPGGTEVTAGPAESNGSLLPVYGVIHFGNDYGKTLPF